MAKEMYEKKTENFLKEKNIKLNISKVGTKPYFVGEKENRDVYKVTLDKDGKKVSYTYGASINDTWKGRKPTKGEVLYAFSRDKYEGSYDDFLGDYGYENNKESKKIYSLITKNSEKYDKIFTEEDKEKLDEIYEDF